jgi:cytochrome c peroxidase
MTRNSTPAVLFLTLVLSACGGGGGGGGSSEDDGGSVVGTSGGPMGPTQLQLEELGEKIFKDVNLSDDGTGTGTQSCESCHDPASGFADPDSMVPVSAGAIATRLGTRNSPTISYAAFIPAFSRLGGTPRGGQFLDGRQPRLEEQAQQPFLNPNEMNMADEAAVITAIMAATYVDEFKTVFGDDIFSDIDDAYVKMSQAIAAFERSAAASPFTSDFDREPTPSYMFTPSEARGRAIFTNLNCDRCHTGSIFSNFEYENIGVPSNPDVVASAGSGFIDEGLKNFTGLSVDAGKFRTPTLRNVASTGPYMHNGVFASLEQVIIFYNDLARPTPEVATNVTTQDVGNLGMDFTDRTDLENFLRTLTDL